jgi:hypothetical protein
VILLVSVVFISGTVERFRVPVDPYLLVLAAVALVTAWSRFRAAEDESPPVRRPRAQATRAEVARPRA